MNDLWQDDVWFAKHWANKVTLEFETWWFGYYGFPTDYSDHETDPHIYYEHAGFALSGWLAQGKLDKGII